MKWIWRVEKEWHIFCNIFKISHTVIELVGYQYRLRKKNSTIGNTSGRFSKICLINPTDFSLGFRPIVPSNSVLLSFLTVPNLTSIRNLEKRILNVSTAPIEPLPLRTFWVEFDCIGWFLELKHLSWGEGKKEVQSFTHSLSFPSSNNRS